MSAGILLLQVLSCASDRSTSSHSTHKHFTLDCVSDFRSSCQVMCFWIIRICKLLKNKRIFAFSSNFLCHCHCSFHSICSRCENHFSSERKQDHASLDRHRIWHGQHKLVSTCSCNKCQSDSSITRSWLNKNSFAWSNLSRLLSFQNHRATNTILYRIAWLHAFKFSIDMSNASFSFWNSIQLDQRGISDQIGSILRSSDTFWRRNHPNRIGIPSSNVCWFCNGRCTTPNLHTASSESRSQSYKPIHLLTIHPITHINTS
mmetsp:Transcript_4747/g.8289  ORF Transcript_4747/g.8289 Transcript_4747/m.8289 type:complete len:260 (-) Transcript_4747:54-833(-)